MAASKIKEATCGNKPETFPTVVDIKKNIPKYCFEPKVSTSMYYVARDFVAIASLHLIFELISISLPWYVVYTVAPGYMFMKGTFFLALFIIGHDCCHGSFSSSSILSDVVGAALHTFLLMPYSCWKFSHRVHHKNTCNIDKDEMFYPLRKENARLQPANTHSLFWKAYLALESGPRSLLCYDLLVRTYMYAGRLMASAMSILFNILWATVLYRYAMHYGWGSLVLHYLIPVVTYVSWGFVITFLQHADDDIAWASGHKWNYMHGQLSTVDRHYGWLHGIIHNVGTHQIHHLFPKSHTIIWRKPLWLSGRVTHILCELMPIRFFRPFFSYMGSTYEVV
ncbi:sn-1 acyl-lipid omega-3 desaturase (ferredoxin)-like [Liolophura sinensis]|uniref:sn-1 acyl-lipid omega-3 desaturase (ferredoxin)-like n=1 Tax=Liolophura sinensis TaxID=3198878 RepID=UPI003159140B